MVLPTKGRLKNLNSQQLNSVGELLDHLDNLLNTPMASLRFLPWWRSLEIWYNQLYETPREWL